MLVLSFFSRSDEADSYLTIEIAMTVEKKSHYSKWTKAVVCPVRKVRLLRLSLHTVLIMDPTSTFGFPKSPPLQTTTTCTFELQPHTTGTTAIPHLPYNTSITHQTRGSRRKVIAATASLAQTHTQCPPTPKAKTGSSSPASSSKLDPRPSVLPSPLRLFEPSVLTHTNSRTADPDNNPLHDPSQSPPH